MLSVSLPVPPVTVVLQPFNGLSASTCQQLATDLKRTYGNVVVHTAVPLPAAAYYAPRGRYRADSLIRWLSARAGGNEVIVGVTSQDVSASKNGIKDWGIMGLGYIPGVSCVISTFRLNKEHVQQEILKLAWHELGHTRGLPHCPVAYCYMRDAEGKNHLSKLTSYCPDCLAHVKKKGLSTIDNP